MLEDLKAVRSVSQQIACLLLALGWTAAAAGAPNLEVGEAPDTGLRYWHWQEAGISFKLTQRLPDQTRAFFAARGFDKPARERIALACVFQSEFQNTAGAGEEAVRFDLTEWRVHQADAAQPLLVRETWREIWKEYELPRSARIAFKWALLPTVQQYETGDYNWGMTAYGLPPGTTFDLEFSWYRGDKHYVRRIEGIECAPDIHPDPE